MKPQQLTPQQSLRTQSGPLSWPAAGMLAAWMMAAWMMTARAAVPPDPAAHAATIEIKGFAFAPRAITIAVGTTVTWRNLDPEPHTVRNGDVLVRSDALDQGDSYSVKFDQRGTYHYGCSIHPQMSGTIVVQ
jgi:plastocyanin